MIWLTWRQLRVQASAVLGLLAVLDVVLAVTGPGIADDYARGIAACHGDACDIFARRFADDHRALFIGTGVAVLFVPAIVGLFWGAPLITRELEAGTHRLVWNQTVTRTRWLAVKLAVTGAAAIVAALVASLAVTWWAHPLDAASARQVPRLTPIVFDARGIVPLGHAAFAFVLGVAVGTLVRRTLPAMAVTLAVFAAVQVAVPMLVRPHLIAPVTTTTAITARNMESLMMDGDKGAVHVRVKAPEDGSWTLANDTLDARGRVVSSLAMDLDSGPCAPPPPGDAAIDGGPSQACFDAMAALGYRQRVVYQPADRFWPLQWMETGMYAVLALVLSGLCFWTVRRRVT
ncbi:ABC transporter permease subunit [Actinomadura atramentaria]|uniref:ABC transporter permease subunit n=1 Tax=Actinomadura atramentaria TaxID=1990 RepID=UPI0003812740|nr:ABC transporter permease subunit [Actinomadura atramentaria]